MTASRRSYRREDPAARRLALIAATLELVAENGPEAATVRAIADRAGVTQGMIRHYFTGKEALISAAYDSHMQTLDTQLQDVIAGAGPTGAAQLTAMVVASVTPPLADMAGLSVWAGFIHMVRRHPQMQDVHADSYHVYRDRLQGLITRTRAEAGRPLAPDAGRALAISCNALIDGLWLEAGALPDAFAPGEITDLALAGVSRLCDIDLGPAPDLTAPNQTASKNTDGDRP